MRIETGMPAPTFETIDLEGRQVALAAFRGSPVLLCFFRNAACALCNLRVHALIEKYPDFQAAGLAVVAVFESTAEAMHQYVGAQRAPFSLVADPGKRLYALYGVESSEALVAATMAMPGTQDAIAAAAAQGFSLVAEEGSNFLRMPAEFLINAEGEVVDAHYASYVWDHLPFARIEEYLATTAKMS